MAFGELFKDTDERSLQWRKISSMLKIHILSENNITTYSLL